jgi:hypothetical protein
LETVSPVLSSEIRQLKKRKQRLLWRVFVEYPVFCCQVQTSMNEERTRLVLKQQKRCGELQLVFHDQCGPYSGVVDETVPQGMPEKGKKGLNF